MTTTLSHSNKWLHLMLTDQGAFAHEHIPDSFEDVGDAENGPELIGGPAFDRYSGDSHEFIVDGTGTIVASYPIDWDQERWIAQMIAESGSDQEWPEAREAPVRTEFKPKEKRSITTPEGMNDFFDEKNWKEPKGKKMIAVSKLHSKKLQRATKNQILELASEVLSDCNSVTIKKIIPENSRSYYVLERS